ncbi:hypothetical protein IEQ34_018106 [Dendrobium chrysotoxum]|uniref:Uncharacterized protein n=1 Tax=Dendrobium chrysotoxum TaxID=161865 RepID=A0AAV7GDX9_DENCH|nr:hypothetical protein IEQ34_018106 [Dendrobium chrysotoxum]
MLVTNAGIKKPLFNVKKILFDNGSTIDYIFYRTFFNISISKEMLRSIVGPLYGFNSSPIWIEGIIDLLSP